MVADAVDAMTTAAYAALSAPGAVSVAVYSHAPLGTQPPVCIVGNVDNVIPIGRADDPDRRGILAIIVMTEGEEKEPCVAVQGEILQALNGRSFGAGDFTVTFYFETSSAELHETGLGYVGESKFSAIALAD